MPDNAHFADIFNYYIYDGRQVIKPEDLEEKDAVEETIIKKIDSIVSSQKIRDVLKGVAIKSNKDATFAILGIENQSEIHYAMPVKCMIYDALNYSAQVSSRAKELKNSKNKISDAEYLSGFSKNDKLPPVITLVINWSDKEWDGPIRLSDMFDDMNPDIMNVVEDYGIKLIDPYQITDFNKFHTMLGDVLELIKSQNEEDCFEKMLKKKGSDWKLDIDSINMINTYTGAQISTDGVKENVMEMCRAAASLVEKGMEKGTNTINKLNLILIDSGRIDDLTKASKDPDYQKKLIAELIPEDNNKT